MIEILILYVLNRHDLTIYKLERAIGELFFPFFKPSLGSIAPTLEKLSERGFVNYSEKFSQGGLKSKTFSITPTGLAYLKKSIVEYKFKGLNSTKKTADALLFMKDILNDEEISALQNNVETNLKIFKAEIERTLSSPYIRLDENQREILKRQ